MSYTNQTPNYGLPQYVADDKPTYLGDFNKAMLDIDTNMKSIDTKDISAETNAQNANETSTEALNTAAEAVENATAARSTASEAKTIATNAQTTASNAQSTASTASTNASTALSTANNATSNASTAVSTANAANSTANAAITKINTLNPVVLWNNPNPSTEMPNNTEIVLNDNLSDYDYYEIIFTRASSQSPDWHSTGRVLTTAHSDLYCFGSQTNAPMWVRSRKLQLDTANNKFISGQAQFNIMGQSNYDNDNGACVPVQIIGYKLLPSD